MTRWRITYSDGSGLIIEAADECDATASAWRHAQRRGVVSVVRL